MSEENDEELNYHERIKNETVKAFTYFNTYLELGPNRSLSKVREEHNNDVSLAQLKNYSSKYHWVKRAERKDEDDILRKKEELEKEQKEYFDKRLEQLDQYHQATDAVLGQLMVDLGLIPNPKTKQFEPNDRVNSTTVANSIQSLTNANAVTSKLALRFLGLPEQVQDKQEVELKADVETNYSDELNERYVEFNEAIMNTNFINKQLELIDKMIEKKENKHNGKKQR